MKNYCLLWTDFTPCPNAFIVDFEQVSAGWEDMCEIDYGIQLNEFSSS